MATARAPTSRSRPRPAGTAPAAAPPAASPTYPTSSGEAARAAPAGARTAGRALGGRRGAVAALGALTVVYLALAALFATPGSKLVPATAGGSPGWLLGPSRAFGLEAAAGPLAGVLFYTGLWLALAGYAFVVARAPLVPARLAVGAVAGLHAAFLLAPPLLSQDAFSYLAYARLEVLHGLDPYATGAGGVAADPVLAFAGSKDIPSVYGPAFTLLARPLALVPIPVGFWVLKAAAAAASLGAVALVWRAARRRGSDPVRAGLVVGLNPAVLVHMVGGAHNDAIVMTCVAGAALAFSAGRASVASGVGVAATAVKASAAVVVPFFIAGARRVPHAVIAGLAVAAVLAAGAFVVYGQGALALLETLGANQAHASSFSLPEVTAKGVVLVTGSSVEAVLAPVRYLYAAAFVVVVAGLVWRTRRGADAIVMAGWATLALVACSAWLVPWYLAWLLPLAALAGGRRLLVAAIAMTAWTLAVAIPF